MSKQEKINEIIEKNGFSEWDLENPLLLAKIALGAWGLQYQGGYATLGLYQGEKLVAKVKMPDPLNNPWFGIGFAYESPRVANIVGFVVDFEAGEFKGSSKELGLSNSSEWKLGYDHKVQFDNIKILVGKEALPAQKKVEAYA